MSGSNLKATIFIPTYFGEKYLEKLLTMVFKQEVPYEYEVLIFDTSSTDRTPQIIESFQRQHSNLRFKTITKQEFGHGRTRNQAAHEAKGEIVVYLSQDAIPAHKRWLYEMIRPFEINEKIVGVVGKQWPRRNCVPLMKSEINGVFGNLGPEMGTTLFYKDDFANKQNVYEALCFYSDVNSAARRHYLLEQFPYRDVQYAEDQLLGRDIIDAGYYKAFAPRGVVWHSNDLTLREYKHRLFDETIGLREIGAEVPLPSFKAIVRMFIRGNLRDTRNTLRDKGYSFPEKLYWLMVNPFFHIEKWRGICKAIKADLDDPVIREKYSLERKKKNT